MSKKRHRLHDGRYLYEVTPAFYLLQNEFQNAIEKLTVEVVELPSTLEPEVESCQDTQELGPAV